MWVHDGPVDRLPLTARQYNDVRQEDGFKNAIIANRMIVESRAVQPPLVDPSEAEQVEKNKVTAY